MDLTDVLGLVKSFGPAMAAVVWFLYRDYRREGVYTSQITALQTEMRDTVFAMVKSCTETIERNTATMDRNNVILQHLDQTFGNRHPRKTKA